VAPANPPLQRTNGPSTAVVAIEGIWYERLQSCRLYCYHLAPDTFECIDECAGYFVSSVAVAPAYIETIANPINELVRLGVELRMMPNLWKLRDAVVASSLQFSIIRMRNALPRAERRWSRRRGDAIMSRRG
jgi:hypothetical protein